MIAVLLPEAGFGSLWTKFLSLTDFVRTIPSGILFCFVPFKNGEKTRLGAVRVGKAELESLEMVDQDGGSGRGPDWSFFLNCGGGFVMLNIDVQDFGHG